MYNFRLNNSNSQKSCITDNILDCGITNLMRVTVRHLTSKNNKSSSILNMNHMNDTINSFYQVYESQAKGDHNLVKYNHVAAKQLEFPSFPAQKKKSMFKKF